MTSIKSRHKRWSRNNKRISASASVLLIYAINIIFKLSARTVDTGIVHSFSILDIINKQQYSSKSIVNTKLFQSESNISLQKETDAKQQQTQDEVKFIKPKWMKCINAEVPKTCALNEAVSILSGLSLVECNELISIGAVWLGYDEYDYYYDNIEEGKEEEEEIPVKYERILEPCVVDENTKIRIYPYPRRYKEASDECKNNYSTRLLYEDTTFLVFDKPPMLPTQADASNYNECLPGSLLPQYTTIDNVPVNRLNLCHRVDAPVGGCVVMSKDKHGQGVFSSLQRERKIKKLYLAVTTDPIPVGRHVHYMWAKQVKDRGSFVGPTCQLVRLKPPGSKKSKKFWVRCVLEVTKSIPIAIPNNNKGDFDPNNDTQYYENTIRLVTGRKHQVRAQLSAIGCPIIRDSLYGPMKGITLDQLGDDEEDELMMDQAISQSRVPYVPIGLQAHAILFSGIRVKAGDPWWR